MKIKIILVFLILLCLCTAISFSVGNLARNSSFWYGNDEVLLPHREDFSPDIPRELYSAFGPGTEVLKVYPSLSRTMWFLMENFQDFSQIVTAEPIYIVHESENQYSSYSLTESGEVISEGGASVTHSTRPYGLFGLDNEMIQAALEGIDYEDYIITDSSAVIVWVRRESGDLFLTYPTRPDLMGIQVGQIYTLEELKATLANAYHSE